MAKLLKLRRGTTSQHTSFTGAEGEVTVDIDKETLVVHDGSTAGGHPVAAEDMANVSSASIAGRLGTDSIATTKIAAGALPTDVTVASANIVDGTIVNADVNGSAAIAQSKLDIADATTSAAGYMSAADKTKIDGIETAATADQTAAEIRTLVENASDSNVFTDADHTKLNGIETAATADQTAAEIVSLINAQNITPANLEVGTGRIGHDGNDYFTFTNNSQCDLYINGNNEFRFEADGDFHADGDVIAQSTTISSDRNLKENIEVIPNALDKIEALNGVSFDWKKTGEKSAGVIAQEVQEVLPEAVKEVTPLSGGDSHLTVNYHALTSILIEAIKELKAELNQHKQSCCGGK